MTEHGSRRSDSVLSPAHHAAALTIVVAAACLFLALAVAYSGDSTPGRVDILAGSMVSAVVRRGGFMEDLIAFGDPLPVVVATAVLAGVCVARRRHRLALFTPIAVGMTGLATTIAKPAVGRTLEGDLAYPSGHAAAAVSLGIVTTLIVVDMMAAGATVAVLALTAVPIVSGGSMTVLLVATGWHYLTDTVGGACVALAMTFGTALALDSSRISLTIGKAGK